MTQAPLRSTSLPRGLVRPILATMAGWLSDPTADRIAGSTGGWSASDWAIFRRLITIHGLAAQLSRWISEDDLADVLPANVHSWLLGQDRLNRTRIDRLHAQLAEILAASGSRGIAAMPLKGALLTTMAGMDPYRRPLGDLDLLVRPGDRVAMRRLLEDLGYAFQPVPRPRATHDVYMKAGESVVSEDEHPDNPRPVEIHTEVVRHLWGWSDEDNLTAALWAGASSGLVLGEEAVVPTADDLLTHVAVHASSNMLVGAGRLIQWVDLGALRQIGVGAGAESSFRLAYPALRMTARTMAGSFDDRMIAAMDRQVPAALSHWASSAPLDDRCGLMIEGLTSSRRVVLERWRRWGPSRWRFAVAYGDVSIPVAFYRHAGTLARIWRERYGDAGPVPGSN